MRLHDIQRTSHENSRAHGFWDGPENDNVPTKLALIHSEVSEALEAFREGKMETGIAWKNGPTTPPFAEIKVDHDGSWVREGPHDHWVVATDEAMASLGFLGKPEGFPSELADVIIRVADLAERLGIDLEHEIQLKYDYNQTREKMHGGKRV